MRSLVFCTTCRQTAAEPTGPDGLPGVEGLARSMVAVRGQACPRAGSRPPSGEDST
jgi:hypothetical protein